MAGNPVSSTPDGRRLGEAIAGLDFVAAVDIYVNETTRHADVILPPTSALERDHYDLVFHALAVRNTARFTPGAVRRSPTGADARLGDLPRDRAAHPAAARPRSGRCKRRLVQAGADAGLPRPGPSTCCCAPTRPGSRCAGSARGPVDLGPLEPCLPERLMTPDHRVAAAPRQVLDDLARLDAVPAGPTPTGCCWSGAGTSATTTPGCTTPPGSPRAGRGTSCCMHPDDLAARGIADGAVVRVASAVGAVEVEVQATDDMMPGVVSLPHGYGHRQRRRPAARTPSSCRARR